MHLWIMYRHASVVDATVTTWTGSHRDAFRRLQSEGGRQAELFKGNPDGGEALFVASVVDGEFKIITRVR